MNKKRAFLWNMIGSACYSVSSILYLMIVTRICGAEVGGFFSLAYATAQLLLTIGRYGMRTYQATDLRAEYRFQEYAVSRVLSVAAMLLLGIGYSLFAFEGGNITMSVLVVAMKALDAVEDVYHGRLQQTYHVEQMGKSQALRNTYTALCFTVLLWLTRNLLLTLWVTVLSSLVLCLLINQSMIRRYAPADKAPGAVVRFPKVLRLMGSCTGLFVGTFLSLFLYNLPKYAMAGRLSAEYQTYYSILFMPSFVVTLLCEFVFKPTITNIAEFWFSGQKQKLRKTLVASYGMIVASAVVVVLGGHFIGRWLLELLYNVDLSPYKTHFLVLLIGGGIGAGVYMTYNILIAFRYGQYIKWVYAAVGVVCVLVVVPMVNAWGMMGAALNYLLSCTLLLAVFGVLFISVLRKGQSKPAEE